jgi:hypothetical protein
VKARSPTPHDDEPPLVALPTELSDEAAAKLLEWLYETGRVLENHYAAQLHRYYHRPDERQQPLWPGDGTRVLTAAAHPLLTNTPGDGPDRRGRPATLSPATTFPFHHIRSPSRNASPVT